MADNNNDDDDEDGAEVWKEVSVPALNDPVEVPVETIPTAGEALPTQRQTEVEEKQPGLLDFGEEEEEEDADDSRLLPASVAPKPRKKKLRVEERDEDDDEDDHHHREEEDVVRGRSFKPPQLSSSLALAESSKMPEAEEAFEDDEDGAVYEDEEPEAKEDALRSLVVPDLEAVRPLPDSLFYTHLPRFLHLNPLEFVASEYDEMAERNQLIMQGNEVDADCSVIRWRYKVDELGAKVKGTDGQDLVESNANLVEYEDGSFRLFIGSDPVDVTALEQRNEFVYVDAEAPQPNTSVSRVLVGLGQVRATLNLRPSKQSQRTQMQIVHHLRLLNRKTRKTEMRMEQGMAPEVEQDERIKQNEKRSRQAARKRNQAKSKEARTKGEWDSSFLEQGARKKSPGRRRNDKDEEDEEDDALDDDEEDDFIAAEDEDDDEEEEEEEKSSQKAFEKSSASKKKTNKPSKRLVDSYSEGEGDEEDD